MTFDLIMVIYKKKKVSPIHLHVVPKYEASETFIYRVIAILAVFDL